METQFLVLTLLGEDRPGLVELLSQIIAAHEGNWLESRMSHLAGKFAGILRASVPAVQTEALTQALHRLEAQGLRIMLEWSATDTPPSRYQRLKLDLLGHDRPGIIRDISHALVWRGINIDELQTEYTSAPMSGVMLFKATAYLRVPPEVVIAEFQDNLEQVAHDLMVDVTLQAVPDRVPD